MRSVEGPLRAVLGRLGPVRDYADVLLRAGDPRIFAVAPRPASFGRYVGTDVPGGSGAGYSREQAVRSALGETVERYASSCWRVEELIHASASTLGTGAVGFDRFEYFSRAQNGNPKFPFPHYDRDVPYHWCLGTDLATGAQRYVPASLAYLNYDENLGDMFALAVSTGTACHSDPTLAALHGLYEVIERDAFMISWLRKLPLPRIRIESDPVLGALYRRHFEGSTFSFHNFDMTTDFGIPAVLTVAQTMVSGSTIFGVGAACRLSPRQAVAKSMLEATTTVMFARTLLDEMPDFEPGPNFDDVRNFEDHVRLFCEPEMAPHLDFLLESEREVDLRPEEKPGSADVWLKQCLERVSQCGHEAIMVDLTTHDLRQTGLSSTKVFIPGTVPMTSTHGIQPLGSPRLRHVPSALGYDVQAETFNRIPHPFP